MKTKPFSELQKRMTPEQRAKSDARAKLVSFHIALIELKQYARNYTRRFGKRPWS